MAFTQLELANVRHEIDTRLQEKDEEFEQQRKMQQRVVDAMQASLEAELKSKAESVRHKKKLEGDINQLEVALDQLNRSYAELQKCNKKQQQQIAELNAACEDEQSQKLECKELAAAAERRAQASLADLENARHTCEQVERARKACENELHDAADRIAELSACNVNLVAAKRKCESDLAALRTECDETIVELKNSEDRVKRAACDAARLIEELRQEQVILI